MGAWGEDRVLERRLPKFAHRWWGHYLAVPQENVDSMNLSMKEAHYGES